MCCVKIGEARCYGELCATCYPRDRFHIISCFNYWSYVFVFIACLDSSRMQNWLWISLTLTHFCCYDGAPLKVSHKTRLTSTRRLFPMFVTRSTNRTNVLGSGCGCLSDSFVAKAHTDFTSILIEAQSQEVFVGRVKALPRHAVDDHPLCSFHPQVTCSCSACESKYQIESKGKTILRSALRGRLSRKN